MYSYKQLMCGHLNLHMTHLLKFVVHVLRGNEKGFNGVTPFEVHLDPQVVACPFEPFHKLVDAWYHHGDVFAV